MTKVETVLNKLAKKDMPHFEDQKRDPKAKEVYRALKREHPGWSAGKKARIAEATANKMHKKADYIMAKLAIDTINDISRFYQVDKEFPRPTSTHPVPGDIPAQPHQQSPDQPALLRTNYNHDEGINHRTSPGTT